MTRRACMGWLALACSAFAPSAPAQDAFYLSRCVMCPSSLGSKGDSVDFAIEGREIRLCSDACRALFERAPTEGWSRVDRAMMEDQRPHYPLRVSIISGEPLAEQPIDVIWGNRLFRVNTERERDELLRDPETSLRALDRAVIDAQRPTYGLPDKCPVQGDILESDTPIDIVVANRMIRVCCSDCVRTVRARPSQYLALVDYANRHPALPPNSP